MEAYKLLLKSQLGPREGTLRLEADHGVLTGTLTLLGHENPVSGEWTSAHSFRLSHHLQTAVSDLVCVSEFEVTQGQLTGTVQAGRTVMLWSGEKIPEEKDGNSKYERS